MRGPCTPRVRTISRSALRLGPLIQVSALGQVVGRDAVERVGERRHDVGDAHDAHVRGRDQARRARRTRSGRERNRRRFGDCDARAGDADVGVDEAQDPVGIGGCHHTVRRGERDVAVPRHETSGATQDCGARVGCAERTLDGAAVRPQPGDERVDHPRSAAQRARNDCRGGAGRAR